MLNDSWSGSGAGGFQIPMSQPSPNIEYLNAKMSRREEGVAQGAGPSQSRDSKVVGDRPGFLALPIHKCKNTKPQTRIPTKQKNPFRRKRFQIYFACNFSGVLPSPTKYHTCITTTETGPSHQGSRYGISLTVRPENLPLYEFPRPEKSNSNHVSR